MRGYNYSTIKLFYLQIIILLITNCTSKKLKNFDQSPFTNSKWLETNEILPQLDSLYYLNDPSPLFRKEFITKDNIKSAKLFITSAGYYLAYINDNRVGKIELDPAWTDYSKRIYYSEYDVSELIQSGKNCIGVTLGNGFYNPLPMKMWGRINLRDHVSTGKPKFISKLLINYEDGSYEEIFSDSSWKYSYGPIIKNSVYIGSSYDANYEVENWSLSSFDDSSWKEVNISISPGGELLPSFFPPVKVVKEIEPQDIYPVKDSLWIIDMGENFTGTYSINMKGEKGDTIIFRFGERIYEDGSLNPMTAVTGQIKREGIGGPGAPTIAWQTDSYIFSKSEWITFKPEFTYHAYRYMDISGLKYKPQIKDIKGLLIHSDVVNKNKFVSSSDLINNIQDAVENTFLANLVSVQSDCPAREKFGYGGDLNATSESFIYNFDMNSIYKKTVYDWIDAMNDSIFVDTAPYVGINYCGLSWESAFIITQYYLYLYYDDSSLVKELYDINDQWMSKVSRIHPNGIVDSGLSDHESLKPVPVELTGTLHYMQTAKIMSIFSSIVGNNQNIKKYDNLVKKLKNLILDKFWKSPTDNNINKQTLFSSLLYHEVIPKEDISAAKDSLLNALKNGPSGHLNTGIFGTKYMLETVSKYLSPQLIFDVVNDTRYPGWGHMIDRGATTIWETWKESDNVFSNSHPMFGVVTEWFYKWLGGIQLDINSPGFKNFIIRPFVPKGLDSIDSNYNSNYGEIVSNWKKNKLNEISYEIRIPKNSSARIYLPEIDYEKIVVMKDENEINISKNYNDNSFILNEGSYMIYQNK